MTREIWNTFVATAPGGSFLQSWEWGQLQEELGVPYWRLSDESGVALVVKRELPWGKNWLYVPRGPLTSTPTPAAAGTPPPTGGEIFRRIIDLARREGSVFIRSEPHVVPGQDWQKAVNDVQPRHTIILDITQSGEDLLGGMHQKTRYNIRLAQRKGVAVRFSRSAHDLTSFLVLSKQVSERAAFSYHPDSYYEALLQLPMAELAIAEFEGVVLAVHMLVSFGDTVTYVHGASSSEQRSLMAPQLLQWESIKRAKVAGYKKYDFFGVAPLRPSGSAGQAPHAWDGITKFKEGFGGHRVSYVGAYDYILDSMWYWTYSTSRKVKSFLR